ncbi:bacteriocin-like protein [Chryseobacterium pyrolae]|uniref:bacteriocin-like protein n=1 Tax=Chryseobacterium pyrolae TaxID=2987481 RepID=UPI003C2FA1F5
MKNLRKLSNRELKSIQGGIQGCYYLANGTYFCPCRPGYFRCVPTDASEVCKPNGTLCI